MIVGPRVVGHIGASIATGQAARESVGSFRGSADSGQERAQKSVKNPCRLQEMLSILITRAVDLLVVGVVRGVVAAHPHPGPLRVRGVRDPLGEVLPDRLEKRLRVTSRGGVELGRPRRIESHGLTDV
jgi:hypothetical protein